MSEQKQKLKQVKVYFQEADFLKLKDEAVSENLSMAELIRQKVNLKIDNPPAPKSEPKKYEAVDPKLLYELKKIGNNINQIAKKLHSKNELEVVMLRQIYNKVMSL